MSTELPVFQRILVAVDQGDASNWATESAARLASALGARVAVLHVIDISRGFAPEFGFADDMVVAQLRPSANEVLDRAVSMFPAGVEIDRLIREGDPPQEIVIAADRWQADLVVVGTHGHGRLARLLLGSTAEAVVRSAHCPVLTVGHEPKSQGPGGGGGCAVAAAGQPVAAGA